MYIVTSDNLSAVYRKMNEYLSNGYAVIYAAELETSLSTDQIFSNLQKSGIIEGIKRHIETGALTILNKEQMRSSGTAQIDIQTMSDAWLLVEKMKRKNRFKRFLVISDASLAFSEAGSLGKLVEYERQISKMLADKKAIIHVICCYVDSSIKKMPLAYLIPVVAAHQCSVHYQLSSAGENWLYKQWQPGIILELMHREIERALGSGANYLIFRTLDLIYKIKEDAIISQPSVFEDKLRKILGKSVAQSLVDSIAKEIRNRLY